MAGSRGMAGPGLCFVPNEGETDKVVIREQGDVKHVCIRDDGKPGERHLYIIVATVKGQWLSLQIAKLIRENPSYFNPTSIL